MYVIHQNQLSINTVYKETFGSILFFPLSFCQQVNLRPCKLLCLIFGTVQIPLSHIISPFSQLYLGEFKNGGNCLYKDENCTG